MSGPKVYVFMSREVWAEVGEDQRERANTEGILRRRDLYPLRW